MINSILENYTELSLLFLTSGSWARYIEPCHLSRCCRCPCSSLLRLVPRNFEFKIQFRRSPSDSRHSLSSAISDWSYPSRNRITTEKAPSSVPYPDYSVSGRHRRGNNLSPVSKTLVTRWNLPESCLNRSSQVQSSATIHRSLTCLALWRLEDYLQRKCPGQ